MPVRLEAQLGTRTDPVERVVRDSRFAASGEAAFFFIFHQFIIFYIEKNAERPGILPVVRK